MVDNFDKKIENKPLDIERNFSNIEKKEAKKTVIEKESSTKEKKIIINSDNDQDIISQTNTTSEEKEIEKKIEGILEEHLEEVFVKMPSEKQAEFKEEGEKTVKSINALLKQARVNIKKIISLIRTWLSIIPGINKFFLEQESKIKADDIIELKN